MSLYRPNVPDWLVARPIAHRGLHDKAKGVIENSASAAVAAIDRRFAIECDVQLTADGEAVVFHDFKLDRLTGETGPVADRTATALGAIRLTGSQDVIVSLPNFLSLLAGRVPLVLEVKSAFAGDLRLTRRVAEVLKTYDGPVAVKSFDPDIVSALKDLTDRPRGIIAEAHYADDEMPGVSRTRKDAMSALLHLPETRPDFVSWHVNDLPHAGPFLAKALAGLPVMTWTVRTQAQRALAATYADQIVFEGFVP